MVHKLKDSRFNSENKSVRKATNPLARYFAQEVTVGFEDGKDSAYCLR